MAVSWYRYLNKKNLKERGDYGVRVARPGFDAENCSDNQLIFNSGWPILQLCKVIDLDDGEELSRYYDRYNNTWYDTKPNSWTNPYIVPENDMDALFRFGVSKHFARTFVGQVIYDTADGTGEGYEYKYKIKPHYMPFVPFFIPADDVAGEKSEKVLIFNLDIEADADYPYTDAPIPLLGEAKDYGMKSSSVFGDKVAGLSTGQFSQLVQAVKTQRSSVKDNSNGYDINWSPLGPNDVIEAKNYLAEYDAYAFTQEAFLENWYGNWAFDNYDGGFWGPDNAIEMFDGDTYPWNNDPNDPQPPPDDTDNPNVYQVWMRSFSWQFPQLKGSLIILRKPMVSSEVVEVTL